MMSSSASGAFPFSHTVPSSGLSGSAWDASTVTGPQHMHNAQEQNTPLAAFDGSRGSAHRQMPQSMLNGLPSRSRRMSQGKPQSQEMRRIASKSSSQGRISKVSSSKGPQKLPKSLSQGNPDLLGFEHTNLGLPAVNPAISHAQPMDVSQYVFPDSTGMMMPAQLSEPQFYNGIGAMPWTTLPFEELTMNPAMAMPMPLDMDTSHSGGSPSTYSGGSSPPGEDPWASALPATPPESATSNSPRAAFAMDDFAAGDVPERMLQYTPDGTLIFSNQWTGRRSSGDGESARDHHLYKNVSPQADGLFHCPWEGQSVCNHKPEKLKCNYDKFVDSHLKPYTCKVKSCESARFSSTACLLRHEREAHAMHGHGDKPFDCKFPGCERGQPGNGFPRRWNLHDHMKRVHNIVVLDSEGARGAASNITPAILANAAKAKESSKGRKRKGDSSSSSTKTKSTASSSRKSSTKVEEPVLPDVMDQFLYTEPEDLFQTQDDAEWNACQAAMSGAVGRLTERNHPQVLEYLKEAQEQLDSMVRITNSNSSGASNGTKRSHRSR